MVDKHIVPLELGGSNDLSDRELGCTDCAKAKTRADREVIAKVARIRRHLAGGAAKTEDPIARLAARSAELEESVNPLRYQRR
jgi:hypothetical protein